MFEDPDQMREFAVRKMRAWSEAWFFLGTMAASTDFLPEAKISGSGSFRALRNFVGKGATPMQSSAASSPLIRSTAFTNAQTVTRWHWDFEEMPLRAPSRRVRFRKHGR